MQIDAAIEIVSNVRVPVTSTGIDAMARRF
jgi:hypothetical protein